MLPQIIYAYLKVDSRLGKNKWKCSAHEGFTGSDVCCWRDAEFCPFLSPEPLSNARAHLRSPPVTSAMQPFWRMHSPRVVFPSLTAVFSEALVAQFTQAFEAVVDVPHFLLQVCVFLVQLRLFGVPLQWGDHILVCFCWWEQKKT